MGAGPPITSPGVTLPGAEYFALAPNRSIALGPRLAQSSGLGAPVSVPANAFSSGQTDILLTPQFTISSGIWIVNSYLIFAPGDFSSELQINGARMGVGVAGGAGNIFLDVGTPLAILSNPVIAQVIIRERDLLVAGLDLGPTFPFGQALHLYHQVAVKNNDPSNPHSFQVAATAITHQVQGLVQ